MQESNGEIHYGTEEEIKKIEEEVGEQLKPLTQEEAKELQKLPARMRSSESAFKSFIEDHYEHVSNELKCKLRYAFKNGFDNAQRIFDKPVLIKKAVDILVEELKDEEYRKSWSANIATAFQMEYEKKVPDGEEKNIYEISNKAAEYFLDLLCDTGIKPEEKIDDNQEKPE